MTKSQMLEEVQGYDHWHNAIDASVVVGEHCSVCGDSLVYRAFQSKNSHRAFALCEKCDTAEEF